MLQKYFVTLLACLLIVTLPLTAAAEAVTVASISFPNSTAVAEENLSVSGFGDKDSGYAPSTNGARLYASVSGTDLRKLEWSKGEYADVGSQPVMTGGTKNPWGQGAYLEVRASTVGYENITFSASLGATKKGPRDYQLQYSLDGTTFKNVAGAFFSVSVNKTMLRAFDAVSLPQDAANAQTLYIRIAVASNMMVNGTAGLIGSTGGEAAVNDVTINGTPIATTTTAPTTAVPTTAATTVKTTVAPAPSAVVTTTARTAEATSAPSAVVTTTARTAGATSAPSAVVTTAQTAGATSASTAAVGGSPIASSGATAATALPSSAVVSASSTAATNAAVDGVTTVTNGVTTASSDTAERASSVQTGEAADGIVVAVLALLAASGMLTFGCRSNRKKRV